MTTETTTQLNSIRQILESLESGWLRLLMNADSSHEIHGRVLTVMTRDIHTQLSEACAIADDLRCSVVGWPDTAELFLGADTAELTGIPDELIRSSLARAKGVSSLVAELCLRCSPNDVDDAIWDIQGRVAEVIRLLPPTSENCENNEEQLLAVASG